MSENPERARQNRRRRSGDGGFTLVEVLVSFTVMAMLLSVLFRGVVTMRAGTTAFDDHMHQDVVAQAILDDALAKRDLAPGSYDGMREGLRWRLDARSIDLTAQLPPPQSDEAGGRNAGASNAAPAASGQSAQSAQSTQAGQTDPATSGGKTPPGKDSTKPQWKPQRLTVRVETNGRPLEIETIRLVKTEAGPKTEASPKPEASP